MVLGNLGGAEDASDGVRYGVPHQVAAVVRDYVAHTDPILRVHAVWAAARLGLHDVLPATDPHPDVSDELAMARGDASMRRSSDTQARS